MTVVLMMPGTVFFVKVKRDLEVLPPTHGALELYITRKDMALSSSCNNGSRKKLSEAIRWTRSCLEAHASYSRCVRVAK